MSVEMESIRLSRNFTHTGVKDKYYSYFKFPLIFFNFCFFSPASTFLSLFAAVLKKKQKKTKHLAFSSHHKPQSLTSLRLQSEYLKMRPSSSLGEHSPRSPSASQATPLQEGRCQVEVNSPLKAELCYGERRGGAGKEG